MKNLLKKILPKPDSFCRDLQSIEDAMGDLCLGDTEKLSLKGIRLLDTMAKYGKGIARISTPGVDQIREISSFEYIEFDDGYLWPEAGLKLEKNAIKDLYVAGLGGKRYKGVEIHTPKFANAIGLYFFPSQEMHKGFEFHADEHSEEPVTKEEYLSLQLKNRPQYKPCNCCRTRIEETIKKPEQHTLFKLFRYFHSEKTDGELTIENDGVSSTCGLRVLNTHAHNGFLTLILEKCSLRINLLHVHCLSLSLKSTRGGSHSLLEVYHALGFKMLTITVPGEEHLTTWKELLSADGNQKTC